MPNSNSLNKHNQNYILDDALEKEKKVHYEKNSNDFKFLYQEDVPHGDALDKYELTSGVDIGSGTGWFANYLVEIKENIKKYMQLNHLEKQLKLQRKYIQIIKR